MVWNTLISFEFMLVCKNMKGASSKAPFPSGLTKSVSDISLWSVNPDDNA